MRVGAVVARFQIDELHAGHQMLLETAGLKSDVLCVVLALNENRGSKRNPLDFVTRKLMVEAWAREELSIPVVVLSQHDQPQDDVWSKNLDRLLIDTFPGAHITLYGGRDSFLKHYEGNLGTVDITTSGVTVASSTSRRQRIASQPGRTAEFRRGVIYGAHDNWPRLFMCVDIALISGNTLYVGKRNNEDGYRFFGGFVDQKDKNLEAAAARELHEEAGVYAAPKYVGSFHVSDYRYKEPDEGQVMTALFLAQLPPNVVPLAGDDIDEIVPRSILFNGYDALVEGMVPGHRQLMNSILTDGVILAKGWTA